MGLLDQASANSYWRGIEYCKEGRVISYTKISDSIYKGIVRGTEEYEVEINIDHPRKSKCNCPFAKDKSTICKHKVALYLTIFPEELKRIIEEQKAYEQEREEAEKKFETAMKKREKEIEKYVKSLNKEQLQEMLKNRLINEEYDYIRENYFDEDDEPY